MRIGVIGWYGHNNAGDERFLYVIKRFFDNHEIFPVSGFGAINANLDLLNDCDFVLIGGGGLILRGFGYYAHFIEKIKPDIGCIGISVEAVHPDNIELINVLLSKARFFVVRDNRSKEVLGDYSQILVGPDLTYLYPYEVSPKVDQDICGVNIRKWNYWKWSHGSRLSHFMHWISANFPSLERIYPLVKWQPQKAIHIITHNFSRILPIPLYTEAHKSKADHIFMKKFFPEVNISSQYNPNSYKECRYFIGMRLHSIIFAAQMGIPFISLSYQPKNIEFCKSIGMERFSVDLYNLLPLISMIDELKENYALLRENLLFHREQNNREIYSIMNYVSSMIGAN